MLSKHKYLIGFILISIFVIIIFTMACVKSAGRADEWEEEIEKKERMKKSKE